MNNPADMDIYWCEFCRGFHLGHSNAPERQQARLDQIFSKVKKKDPRVVRAIRPRIER